MQRIRRILAGVATKESVEARLRSKMQQEVYFEARGAEIVEHLSVGSFVELECRFGFDDELLVHDHIDSLNAEDMFLVSHVDIDLSRHSMTAGEQLTFERHHVDVLEKAEAKGVINLEVRPNDGSRKPLFNQLKSGHATRWPNRTPLYHQSLATTIIVLARSDRPDPLHPPHPVEPLNLDA